MVSKEIAGKSPTWLRPGNRGPSLKTLQFVLLTVVVRLKALFLNMRIMAELCVRKVNLAA